MSDRERAREIATAGTHIHVSGPSTKGFHADECARCGLDIRSHNPMRVTLADRIESLLASVRAEEREACAVVVEDDLRADDGYVPQIGKRIAAAIRARGAAGVEVES